LRQVNSNPVTDCHKPSDQQADMQLELRFALKMKAAGPAAKEVWRA
jgi:hypothetical protein